MTRGRHRPESGIGPRAVPAPTRANRELGLDGRGVMRVLDAAYRIDLPEEAWLDGLTAAIGPAFDRGAGVHSFAVDLRSGATSSPRLFGGDASWSATWRAEWWETFILPMDVAMYRGIAQFGPLSYTSDLFAAIARAMPTFELYLANRGALPDEEVPAPSFGRYPESLNLVASDTSGTTVCFIGNRPEVAREPPSDSSVHLAGLLTAHIAAALRLRSARSGNPSVVDSADVVLSDRGAVVNVREGAGLDASLDAIRHAARTVVRAKRDAAGDSEGRASLVLWQILFSRSFTVVDSYEKDGRRYLVANRNRPDPVTAFASLLTPREREVVALLVLGHANKLIAYELDVAESTVATHIRSIARKLDVDGTSGILATAHSAARPG